MLLQPPRLSQQSLHADGTACLEIDSLNLFTKKFSCRPEIKSSLSSFERSIIFLTRTAHLPGCIFSRNLTIFVGSFLVEIFLNKPFLSVIQNEIIIRHCVSLHIWKDFIRLSFCELSYKFHYRNHCLEKDSWVLAWLLGQSPKTT